MWCCHIVDDLKASSYSRHLIKKDISEQGDSVGNSARAFNEDSINRRRTGWDADGVIEDSDSNLLPRFFSGTRVAGDEVLFNPGARLLVRTSEFP